MVYARKALIHAGLLDIMVSQSHLDNLIETCPQITRNQLNLLGSVGSNPTASARKPAVFLVSEESRFFYWCAEAFGFFSPPD